MKRVGKGIECETMKLLNCPELRDERIKLVKEVLMIGVDNRSG